MCSYIGRAQCTIRDGRRVAKDSRLLLQFSSSQNSISQNSLSNMIKRAYFATMLSCRPSLNTNWVSSVPVHFRWCCPQSLCCRWKQHCSSEGSGELHSSLKGVAVATVIRFLPCFLGRLETFPGATQNLSECLTLPHVQEKQISRVSFSLPCFRGGIGWKTSLHTFLRGFRAFVGGCN